MASSLVVSISGIDAAAVRRCADLAGELDRRNVPLSLLVAPRPAGKRPSAAVLSWVAERAAQGDAVVLHGYDHSANPCRLGGVVRPRPEFAALPAHEAGLRLLAGRAVLEGYGLATDCFAAPRWRASRGTIAALRRQGFAVCADADAVHDLRSGAASLARVHGFGGRRSAGEAAEPWRCRALVLAVARAARRGGTVRVAVDAADLDRPGCGEALLDAVELALHHGAQPTTYAAFTRKPRLPVQTSDGSPRRSTLIAVPSGASRSNNP